jgi:hypothetical protein
MKTLSTPQTSNSLLEIDHILVCLPEPPQMVWLESLGFVCQGPRLQHLARGTASQVLFFENIYLEFAWVEDRTAANRYAQQTGIDFLSRCQWPKTAACPIAIALRQRSDWSIQARALAERIWDYENSAEMAFAFSSDNLANSAESLCFLIPETLALTSLMRAFRDRFQQLIDHPIGIQRLTQVEIRLPRSNKISRSLDLLQQEGLLSFLPDGATPLLQLTFDHHRQNRVLDLREIDLPVVFKF